MKKSFVFPQFFKNIVRDGFEWFLEYYLTIQLQWQFKHYPFTHTASRLSTFLIHFCTRGELILARWWRVSGTNLKWTLFDFIGLFIVIRVIRRLSYKYTIISQWKKGNVLMNLHENSKSEDKWRNGSKEKKISPISIMLLVYFLLIFPYHERDK